jgi:transglutaminase-like putative cysteine protease
MRKHLLIILLTISLLLTSTIYADIPDKNPYLASEEHIESTNQYVIKLAKIITRNTKTDLDKVRAIQTWINDNIDYDYDKLSKHKKGDYNQRYGAINTLVTKKGVCYDFSCLFAALTRSLGMETKLVKKYIYLDGEIDYHAWNEVMIDGVWVTIDITK